MSRAWIFQGNPDHFDIDGALDALEQIAWRVPQYTSEVMAGDTALIWRSGAEAGVLAVGTVIRAPALLPMDEAERRFALTAAEDDDATTRALIAWRRVPFVTKDTIRALPTMSDHQIVTAPMGTVFPLTSDQWTQLASLVPSPPDAPTTVADTALPAPWAWAQRSKGVLPMPGGYSGYLASFESVCRLVAEERPTPGELAQRMEEVLGVSATAARLRESFLRKVGLVRVTDGLCELSTWTQTWRDGGDNRIVAALLHSRCQYLGEMLAATLEPCTTDELLVVANEGYGMGWDTPAQVSNRRGWLQSCGMLEQLADGHLQATAAGRDLLGDLVLHEPVATPLGPQPDARTDEEEVSPGPEERRGEAQPVSSLVQQIIDEVRIAATDSHDPDRLERATRDAFAFLGFRSEWLGGSGKTDVLLDAMLGRDDSYRVIIDCKSTGSGSLSDQQIDWVTLEEHRLKHEAQHVAIVGPSPGGSRLFERAMKHNVAVISVERLVGLCSQHAKTPLGLDAYRSLFAKGGEPDSQEVSERSEDVARLVRLAAVACDAIRNRANAFGRLTARDLFLIVSADPAAEGSSQEELQTILDVLASPLFEIVDGDAESGYRVTTSAPVAALRMRTVSNALE